MPAKTPGTREARGVITAASVTLAAVLVLAALLLRRLTHRHDPLFSAEHLALRLIIGAAIGSALAILNAVLVARLPAFERVRRLAHHAVEGIEPRWHTMLIVALAAGVGEEFFFRGALDPLVGPWFTALGFVIVHGAIKIRDRNGLMFATFLYAASVGLSALNAWQGLEAAMAAHACYDLVMLLWLVHGAALSRRDH
jgi:membrane protease YdiL (CAAX protease family)